MPTHYVGDETSVRQLHIAVAELKQTISKGHKLLTPIEKANLYNDIYKLINQIKSKQVKTQ